MEEHDPRQSHPSGGESKTPDHVGEGGQPAGEASERPAGWKPVGHASGPETSPDSAGAKPLPLHQPLEAPLEQPLHQPLEAPAEQPQEQKQPLEQKPKPQPLKQPAPPAGETKPRSLEKPPAAAKSAPKREGKGPRRKKSAKRAGKPVAEDKSGAAAKPAPSAGPARPRRATRDTPSMLAATSASPRHQLEAWLALMVQKQASDLILRAGGRPCVRVDSAIQFLPGRVPGSGPLLEVLDGIVGTDRMQHWRDDGSVDTALQLDGLGRFRLNAYRQMGEPAVVLRRIAEKPPLLESLELPGDSLEKLSLKKRGIILVTGIAGSGKSTTLAAMIQHMNTNSDRHVITLEDPVEMIFTEQRCVISQREVGTDCHTFGEGLRHALRQSPDAILIGEMRDAETVSAALDATETGHLVLSTLHTVNAAQTVDRILSFFPSEMHKQIRSRLADNVAAVLSQRLLPRKEGVGMVPAVELMLSTPHVRELLEEGRTTEISRVIDQGEGEGLISFNHSLRRLVAADHISLDTALAASDRPEELLLTLRGFSRQAADPAAPPQPQQRPPAGGGGLRMASGG